MTTGSFLRNQERSFNNGLWPNAIGTYESKSWNGTDDPLIAEYRNYILQGTKQRISRAKELRKQKRYADAAKAFGDYHYWKSLAVKRRPRMLEPHPYTMSKLVRERELGSYIYNNDPCNPNSQTVTIPSAAAEGGCSLSVSVSSVTAEHLNQLNGRLKTRLSGSSFNTPVFLAEGRESLDMIFNAARFLSRALSRASRGNFIGALDAFREYGINNRMTRNQTWAHKAQGKASDVAASYLMWNWGIKPLYEDIVAGAEALAHYTEAPFVNRVRVSVPLPYVVTPSTTSWTIHGSATVVARVYLTAYLKEVNVRKLTGLDGWGAAQALWEVTPYSWLSDYILPIGDFLEGRGLAGALEGTFVYSTFSRVKTQVNGGTAKLGSCGFRTKIVGATDRRTQVSLVRTVTKSLQVPLPKIVPLNEAFSWKRAANVVAVATLQSKRWAAVNPQPSGISSKISSGRMPSFKWDDRELSGREGF
jgi:hypothetical protein